MRITILKTGWTILVILLVARTKPGNSYYTLRDFEKVRKIDEHFHYLTSDLRFLEFTTFQNFRILF